MFLLPASHAYYTLGRRRVGTVQSQGFTALPSVQYTLGQLGCPKQVETGWPDTQWLAAVLVVVLVAAVRMLLAVEMDMLFRVLPAHCNTHTHTRVDVECRG